MLPLLNKFTKVTPLIEKPNAKIPRSLKACFLILTVFFGIDVGFTKCLNKKLRTLVKFMSFLVSMFVIAILFFSISVFAAVLERFWMSLVFCQCLVNFLILFFSNFTLYDFIVKLLRVDANVMGLQNERVGYATCVYTCILFLAKFIIGYFTYNDAEDYGLAYLLCIYASLCPDAMSAIFALAYFYIHCFIKKLYLIVKMAQTSLKDVQQYYIDIADCNDRIRGLYDNLLVVELTFETIKLLITLYSLIENIKMGSHSSLNISNDSIYCVHILFRMLMPAIMSEMVYSKIEEVKIELHYQMLKCEDERKKFEIFETLRYMDARDLKHKIWRFIPIDLNLPLNIIKLIITYLIVIVQFSHLYL